jgi:acyl carrier protein
MDNFKRVGNILAEILDLDEGEILPESYLVRELDAESIDLLEVALALSTEFGIKVRDDDIFLKNLRILIADAGENGVDPVAEIVGNLPHIQEIRAGEMVADLAEGPVLQVRDLIAYVGHCCQ